MLFYPTFFETCVLLVLYVCAYNLALFLIFWTLSQFVKISTKTIYNFSTLRSEPAAVVTMTIVLFSMAGVPPFLGFFTKLFILYSLLNTGFFYLYFSFFVLLIFSLYFYVQNIRFLHSLSPISLISSVTLEYRLPISYVYINLVLLVIFGCGFFYVDDFFLLLTWICL